MATEIYSYYQEELKGRYNLLDLSVDGNRMLKHILECEGVDWIKLAEDRIQWLALVSTIMNLWLP
jgi:hypothetical protein